MERARFIDHMGKKIFVLDFTNCQSPEMPAFIDECARQVRSQAKKSVYTITIGTGAKFDFDVVDKLKLLTRDNEPYVIKSAVVGTTGMQQVLLMIVSNFSKRKFELFDTVEKAKAFIASDHG
ncbi:MAG: hypothetical protein A2076_09270 [Geobacteraceae bacterium GWC2_53_11]|nr:MAG: hypothetical protein A2076_09270 [Geobacteraceae bacterium GWC2_53_11]